MLEGGPEGYMWGMEAGRPRGAGGGGQGGRGQLQACRVRYVLMLTVTGMPCKIRVDVDAGVCGLGWGNLCRARRAVGEGCVCLGGGRGCLGCLLVGRVLQHLA